MPERIETSEEFTDTKAGWSQRWAVEFGASKEYLKKWHEQAQTVVDRYLDKRDTDLGRRRLNLMNADVQIVLAMLFGRPPGVGVARRFSDAQDDEGRVAGVLLERMLNSDIERDSDTFASACKNALKDWRLAGMSWVRWRYEVKFGDMLDPVTQQPMLDPETGKAYQQKTFEDAASDYFHWKKVRYSPCNVWDEMRWVAFQLDLTRETAAKVVGKDIAKNLPLAKRSTEDRGEDGKKDPWGRIELWEIWDKEHKCRWHYVEGHGEVLTPLDAQSEANENGSVPDPYGLEGFWPFAEPMVANLTTDAYRATPFFVLAQDIYDGIDDLWDRICDMRDSVKVNGCYDETFTELGEILSKKPNTLVPVANFQALAEKGGLARVMDFIPFEKVAAAIQILKEEMSGDIMLLHQVTGLADIMRGAAQQSATATEQRIKANFGSMRGQDWQQEFARFVSDGQKIKAEIISRLFDPETIKKRANAKYLAEQDQDFVDAAIALIKDEFHCYRVEVKPEQISMSDYAADKQEKSEIIQTVGGYFQAMMPMAQMLGPIGMELTINLASWMFAGLKGAGEAEGILDAAVAQFKAQMQQKQAQPPAPPPPDPHVVAQQMKGQQEQQKIMLQAHVDQSSAAMEHTANLQRIAAETHAGVVEQAAQAHYGGIADARAAVLKGIEPPTPGRIL